MMDWPLLMIGVSIGMLIASIIFAWYTFNG